MNPNQRSRLLVDPPFQLSFLKYTGGLALAVVGLSYGAHRYFFYKFATRGREIGLPADHIFYQFLAEQSRIMDWIFVATALATAVLILTYGLYLSNRIAGPIHRLRNHLAARLRGETPQPLAFRDSDYFQDLADPLNSCLQNPSHPK
jgi:hypothetical protein